MKFLESIRFQDGQFHLLDLHQQRVERTFAAFYPGVQPLPLREILPALSIEGKIKIRVVYDAQNHQIEWVPYEQKEVKTVSFQDLGEFNYSYKFLDRTYFDEAMHKSGTDDVIFIRNGFLTDAIYANIAVEIDGLWYTPMKPLLAGVRRAQLLAEGKLVPTNLRPQDLTGKRLSFINAMLGLGEKTLVIP